MKGPYTLDKRDWSGWTPPVHEVLDNQPADRRTEWWAVWALAMTIALTAVLLGMGLL